MKSIASMIRFFFATKKKKRKCSYWDSLISASFYPFQELKVWKSIYFYQRIHFCRNFWHCRNFWGSAGLFVVYYYKKHQKMTFHEMPLGAHRARASARHVIKWPKMNSLDKIDAFPYPKRMCSSKIHGAKLCWNLKKISKSWFLLIFM